MSLPGRPAGECRSAPHEGTPLTETSGRARAAFVHACSLDVWVRKPGNVSVHSSGHGMDAAVFLASAEAAAGPLCEAGARVGQRIEAAMRATLAVAGCNTNLGILLLCAPVARALERRPDATTAASLQAAIVDVLGDLDIADALAAYRAIALANPGGLGAAAAQDVHSAPSIDLRAAMALAADRDTIARQYVDGYRAVFEIGVQQLVPLLGRRPANLPDDLRGGAPDAVTVAAVQRTYLALMSTLADSHIVRKQGSVVAEQTRRQAQPWFARAQTGADLDADPAFAAWDHALKQQAINPGTTADLTVASLMIAGLLHPEQGSGSPNASESAPKRDAV